MQTSASAVRHLDGPPLSPRDSRPERTLLRCHHPNVLIVGAGAALTSALKELRPFLRHPVVTTRLAELPALPPPGGGHTVVLEHVNALSLSEQRKLLNWLQANGDRTQLISTADRPLLSLVRRGQFLAPLYYRLNVVYLDLTA